MGENICMKKIFPSPQCHNLSFSGMKNSDSFHLSGGVYFCKDARIWCLFLKVEPRPCPQGCIVLPQSSSLVSVFSPFSDGQLFEYALWNSGKISEARVFCLHTQEMGEPERLACPGDNSVLLGFTLPFSLILLNLEENRSYIRKGTIILGRDINHELSFRGTWF